MQGGTQSVESKVLLEVRTGGDVGVRMIDADALKDVFNEQPPEYYTTAYVTGLIDRMPTVTGDNDIISLCRSGVVKKFVGKGVVVMNYDWWSRMFEKDGFRLVPTPEHLGEGDADG